MQVVRQWLPLGVALGAIVGAAWLTGCVRRHKQSPPVVVPVVIPAPCPDGRCPPAPAPRKPWHETGVLSGRLSLHMFSASVGGPKLNDGTEINCDYPGNRHKQNIASKGLGCCVFRSMAHAADFQNIAALLDFPEWMVQKGIAGGGYPSKVTDLMKRICQDRNLPIPDYLQIEDKPEAVIPLLKAACASGRMPCITYSKSPTGRYGGRGISHMVNIPHCDEKWWAILDNNYIGENAYEWMTPEEGIKATSFSGKIWAIIFLDPPPPMPPYHSDRQDQVFASPVPGVSQERQDEIPEGWEWKVYLQDDPPQALLFRYGQQHGNWDILKGSYLPLVNGQWGQRQGVPPIPLPAQLIDEQGVKTGRLAQSVRYRRNGHEISYGEAVNALSVPNDKTRPRIIVIGPKGEREQVLADLKSHAALASFRDQFVVQGYDPNHWHVKDYKFKTDGHPTIYVAEAGGKPLWRQDDYRGGPEALATTLRRVRPYDPANDPGPDNLPLGVPWSVPALGGLAVVAIAVAAMKKK